MQLATQRNTKLKAVASEVEDKQTGLPCLESTRSRTYFTAFWSGQLAPVLQQYRNELTSELAERFTNGYVAAAQRQGLGGALTAANVAALVYKWMGRRKEALSAFLDFYGTRFLQVETVEDYDDIYRNVREEMTSNPDKTDSSLLQLKALRLTADCGFFANQASAEDEVKKPLTHRLKRHRILDSLA